MTAPVPLLMLHHCGGAAHVFDRLVAALPADIEPIPHELPGRGRRWREAPLVHMTQAVADVQAVVARIGRDVAIFGHSMGAYLGIALASHLDRRPGVRCRTLFVSANAAPSVGRLPCAAPLEVSDAEIFQVAQRSGGAVDSRLRDHPIIGRSTADLLRADFSLSQTFLRQQPAALTAADIVVLAGTSDVYSHSELASWRHSTTGACELVWFPGGHFYLNEHPGAVAEAVAAGIRTRITSNQGDEKL
ncbi:alpha/beta fold hydrolase [Micromonospora lupini]|uniref:thioesterase II family protein n=1 Tax=Micromonospora lupini TaxID=285679 RepID=UPI0033EDFCC2